MVKLKELTLKNFKSFKKAEIPINDGFTVIVGANGSGKSNILDALLFALETQSLKLLRASKLTDLINVNAVENYAKVELKLKDKNNNWIISRIIDNTGKSVFRLNNERKSLHEITALLLELGIKNDGHNIVAQGDITRILDYSPDERRQIIDELSGIREFDEKKKEAEKELQKVEEKLKDTSIIMRERENYLAQLEKERNAALDFERLKERKMKIKATIIEAEMKSNASEIDSLNKKMKAIEDEQQKLLEEKKALELEEEALRTKIESVNNEILEKRQQIYSEIGLQLEEYRAKQKVMEEKINSKEQLIAMHTERIKELEKKHDFLKKEKDSLNNRNEEIDALLAEIEGKEKSLMQSIANATEKHFANEKKIIDLETTQKKKRIEIEKKNQALSNVKAMVSASEKEKQIMLVNSLKIKEKIALLEKEINEKTKKEEELRLLESKYHEPIHAMHELEEKIFREVEKEKQAIAAINELRKAITELEKDKSFCPVCERSISLEKKKELKEKKEKEIKGNNFEKEAILKKIDELKKQKNELSNAITRINELKAETKNLKEKRHELKELNEELLKLKEFTEEEKLKTEMKKLEEEIASIKAEESKLESEIRKIKENKLEKELESLKEQISEIQIEKELLLQEKRTLSTKSLENISKERQDIENEIEKHKGKINELKAKITEDENEIKALREKISALSIEEEKAEKDISGKLKEKEIIGKKIENLKEKFDSLDKKIKKKEKDIQAIEIEKKTFEVRIEDLKEEFKEYASIETFKSYSLSELKKEMPLIEKKMQELGAINLKAIESFDELKKELDDVKEKMLKLEEEKNAVLELMQSIEIKRINVFMECFNRVNDNFKKMFFSLFNGEGNLSLTNIDDPLNSGLIIQAKHKSTKMRSIDALSGGEKTLTALAFLFALQLYEPSPFYVFDEADAALDKENTLKMVKIIKEISKESQFIAITHNDTLIKEADQIIGVALTEDKSSVIGLNLKEKIENNKR